MLVHLHTVHKSNVLWARIFLVTGYSNTFKVFTTTYILMWSQCKDSQTSYPTRPVTNGLWVHASSSSGQEMTPINHMHTYMYMYSRIAHIYSFFITYPMQQHYIQSNQTRRSPNYQVLILHLHEACPSTIRIVEIGDRRKDLTVSRSTFGDRRRLRAEGSTQACWTLHAQCAKSWKLQTVLVFMA